MIKKVLITGGTGLLGDAISDLLAKEGYEVALLSRTAGLHKSFKKYRWDIDNNFIDQAALEWADAIIHLAGASVAEKKWTPERKKEILESRTKSSELLFEEIQSNNHKIEKIISASAIGYYGFGEINEVFTEESEPGDDFLADVTKKWEKSTAAFSKLKISNAQVRIGVVLTSRGGAFQKLTSPIKWGVGSPLGSGKQMMSWIHLSDIAGIFLFLLKNKQQGVFNGVAPVPASNEKVTKIAAHMFRMPIVLPNVPAVVLRLLLGEMSDIVINGSNVSSKKIEKAGFVFKFPLLSDAIYDLVLNKS